MADVHDIKKNKTSKMDMGNLQVIIIMTVIIDHPRFLITISFTVRLLFPFSKIIMQAAIPINRKRVCKVIKVIGFEKHAYGTGCGRFS